MPALFAQSSRGGGDTIPLAQLGVGSDGVAVLAKKGDQLVEIVQLAFAPDSARGVALELRLRAVSAVSHPGVRGVLGFEHGRVILEGDSSPPLAELVTQAGLDIARAMRILGELGRAIATAHHVGIVHGLLDPWAVHVGQGDRPRIELTGLSTRPRTHAWVARCTAPEARDGMPEPASDVYALGAMLEIFATDREPTPGVRSIITAATDPDPDVRPSATELVRQLLGAATLVARTPLAMDVARISRPTLGLALGRYELVKQLGIGAMGEVWEARDTAGGDSVAIKLLKPEIAGDGELLRRFRKEGRVLAKVGSPYIANYIDLNEDKGLHYLVLELVAGGSVAGALRRQGKLPERLSLGIIADTCKALIEPHRLGIVHRDVKPDNMMFVRAGIELDAQAAGQLIKLGDFGIARLVEHDNAAPQGATREGAVLGTPEFMAPEQCQGLQVTPATDVYALGCCLFALLTGRPPFVTADDNQMAVILAHLGEAAPRVDALVPEVSPAVADLVARLLEKDPKKRPQDAAEVLAAIEQITQGCTALITAHPSPPVVRERAIRTYAFEWELQASPEALWPFVSNTEKMNRATRLAPVRFEVEATSTTKAKAPQITGSQRVVGVALKWREHPYEWIEGNRHVVLRVFEKGPLRWYVAEVQLERTPGGGTRLRNSVKLEPRGLFGRIASRFEIGFKYRRNLDRVYRRLDAVLAAGPRPEIDPIDPEIELPAAVRERIAAGGRELVEAGIAHETADALAGYLQHASDQDVARIRPIELAAKLGIDEEQMIDACLHATKVGLLAMVWDVICPSCRIPTNVVESLRKIDEHSSCTACNIGFEVDFSRAIELAFRAASQLRDVEVRTFCIGGPAHFPHVVAQVRLAPGERFALPLSLGAGFYVVKSPQLPRSHELRVAATGGVRRIELVLGDRGELPLAGAGDQLLMLANPEPREILVRVERAGDRAFALSAARAMSCAAFRELFPEQQLAPGRLLAVTQATLVVAQLDDAAHLFAELGDSKAFPVAARFFEIVAALAKQYGGSLVKTFGGLAIAAFERPGPGVDAALAIQAGLDAHPVTTGLRCRVAVHRGPMMALTQGGRLDYFGQNVELALSLAATIPPGCVGLTALVCQDVAVGERLQNISEQLGIHPHADARWILHLRARAQLQ